MWIEGDIRFVEFPDYFAAEAVAMELGVFVPIVGLFVIEFPPKFLCAVIFGKAK